VKPVDGEPAGLHVVSLGRKVPWVDLDWKECDRAPTDAPLFPIRIESPIHNSSGLLDRRVGRSARKQSPLVMRRQ
jgi:hypothetical protein